MIVIGFSEKGGTLARQAELVAKASADLESKIGKGEINALAVYSDDLGVYVVASVENGAPVKESKKRGK